MLIKLDIYLYDKNWETKLIESPKQQQNIQTKEIIH